jgi:hypothetical protein
MFTVFEIVARSMKIHLERESFQRVVEKIKAFRKETWSNVKRKRNYEQSHSFIEIHLYHLRSRNSNAFLQKQVSGALTRHYHDPKVVLAGDSIDKTFVAKLPRIE